MPTRWVKFVFAIFLLPICGVLTQTFFTAFARATVTQRLWAAEEFWFFSLGAVLWLIAFFGLPRRAYNRTGCCKVKVSRVSEGMRTRCPLVIT